MRSIVTVLVYRKVTSLIRLVVVSLPNEGSQIGIQQGPPLSGAGRPNDRRKARTLKAIFGASPCGILRATRVAQ